MTENKRMSISGLLDVLDTGISLSTCHMEYAIQTSVLEDLALCLEELEQYRAIGTVEDIQKKMEELERWHTDKINENIKNAFAHTSTLICHNCDHKDDYIEELEAEVEEYKAIGTVEEFKALKEKNEPKKAIGKREYDEAYCPDCGNTIADGEFFLLSEYTHYCEDCGQAVKGIDWQ